MLVLWDFNVFLSRHDLANSVSFNNTLRAIVRVYHVLKSCIELIILCQFATP